MSPSRPLAWVAPGDALPAPDLALAEPNGLLAAGADLSAERLLEAYRRGIFPWYAPGQPVLWWSPDPRMVLYLDEFRQHRSLRKTIRGMRAQGTWAVTLNRDFAAVVRCCRAPRAQQPGTWITDEIAAAYLELHHHGLAHSVELWHGTGARALLAGGLYGVSIGQMFYGESMFARVADASKVALAALVGTLRDEGFGMLDCQQNTRHLASLGARVIPRAQFLGEIAGLIDRPGPNWSASHIDLPVS